MTGHWTHEMFVENADLYVEDLEGRLDEAGEEVEALLDLLEATYDHHPETALDVACGVGRHDLALAERGVEVQGIDLSEPFLERARELADEREVADRTGFRRGDMRDLGEFEGRYDLVLNAYTSFGFFDDATNERVVERMYERTSSGGVLAMELANKDGIMAEFRNHAVGTHHGMRYAETTEYDPRTSRTHTERWVHDADTNDFEGHVEYDVRLYAPAELARIFERAGYEDVRVFESFDGEEVERESTRMLVLGRRP